MKTAKTFWAIAFAVLGIGGALFAQGKEVRWLRVGDLHSYYINIGAEYEMGRTDQPEQQEDGLRWPAQFLLQDNVAAKGLWIGTTNYYDRGLKETVPYKVVCAGTRTYDALTEIMPVDFKMIGRFDHPSVIVDDEVSTDNNRNDIVDEINSNQKWDREIVNRLHSYIGITMTRKMRAFSQQNHENYFICDYTFKNTGIVNLEGKVEQKILTGVYFYFVNRYAFGNEAFNRGWAANDEINWGRNAVNDVVGTDPLSSNFEFRALLAWYGPHSDGPGDGPYKDWGAPNGHALTPLGAVQYVGIVTLHADKSPHDPLDDPTQPKATGIIGSDIGPNSNNQFDKELMGRKYAEMTKGHPPKTMAEELAESGQFANQWGNDGGGWQQGQGFGPYTLDFGDSIHIVVAEGVVGLRREKNIEVATNWYESYSGEGNPALVLPDGKTTNDRELYKMKWVQTGRDSLFQTFRHAIGNFKKQYGIPQPPPPPDEFKVTSETDRIRLTWSANADSWPNFNGYQIYRAIGKPDTFYENIFSCTKATVTHSFDDVTASRGFEYYYYIQTKDDGSTNDVQKGVPLVSSKFWTMTNKGAFLMRAPVLTGLDSIRVVPNPYHVKALALQFEKEGIDRLAFYGLPPACTIKIYTERGDLIRTIDHTNGTGDEMWDSRTTYGQLVVSGLYIAYFEVPRDIQDEHTGQLLYKKGTSIYRKFIIIR